LKNKKLRSKKMTKKKNRKMSASESKCRNEEDSFRSYLREINRIPLLSKEEEMKIARLAAGGDKVAREKLITSNLRFVIMVAKKYQGKGLPFQDLISEGNIGLLSAVKHFDAEKGYRFITYAVWWIRQAISKAIHEKGYMIRLPSKKARDLMNMEKSRQTFKKDVISLDDPISRHENALTIKDLLQDEYYNSPVDHATNNILREELEIILDSLEERAAEVVRCRFGLGDIGPMTLREVGDRCQLSRERVRQIENRAIVELESSSREHKLDSYIA